MQALSLTDEQIALACAALAGTPVALGKEVGASFDSAAFVLQLGQGYFTGVVALEQGLQTHIRRFQYGTALSTERLPDRLRVTRFTQIVWQEQRLPELGASQNTTRNTARNTAAPAAAPPQPPLVKPFEQAQPAVPPPVVQAARPAPASHAVLDAVIAPMPDPAQVQGVQVQGVQVQGAPRERSSEIPATYVEPGFVQATPAVSVQAPSAPRLSAQTFPAQTPSAQTAPVRAAPVPAVQAQVFSAPHYAEPTRVTAPASAVAAVDAEAWERLRGILEQNLGKRSPRVYQLMRTELGAFSGDELMSRLAWQVERIAGATAAKSFRNSR